MSYIEANQKWKESDGISFKPQHTNQYAIRYNFRVAVDRSAAPAAATPSININCMTFDKWPMSDMPFNQLGIPCCRTALHNFHRAWLSSIDLFSFVHFAANQVFKVHKYQTKIYDYVQYVCVCCFILLLLFFKWRWIHSHAIQLQMKLIRNIEWCGPSAHTKTAQRRQRWLLRRWRQNACEINLLNFFEQRYHLNAKTFDWLRVVKLYIKHVDMWHRNW